VNLAIDIGNSTIRVATALEQQIGEVWQISSKTKDVAGELVQILARLKKPVQKSIIASVKPELNNTVYHVVRSFCRSEPVFASLKQGFSLDYSCYEGLLGIDRALCCEAANQLTAPPFVVVDLGTATTINLVDENRRFRGGLIFPGVQMGLAALANNTALLPPVQPEPAVPLIGQNTRECLLAGAVHGTALFLDKAIAKIWSQLGREGATVITGGSAPVITPHLETRSILEPNLLVKGLFTVLNRYGEGS